MTLEGAAFETPDATGENSRSPRAGPTRGAQPREARE